MGSPSSSDLFARACESVLSVELWIDEDVEWGFAGNLSSEARPALSEDGVRAVREGGVKGEEGEEGADVVVV